MSHSDGKYEVIIVLMQFTNYLLVNLKIIATLLPNSSTSEKGTPGLVYLKNESNSDSTQKTCNADLSTLAQTKKFFLSLILFSVSLYKSFVSNSLPQSLVSFHLGLKAPCPGYSSTNSNL